MTPIRLLAALALAALAAGLAPGPAWAAEGCWHNGVWVPEGTQIGGMVCRGGAWQAA